MKTHEWRDCQAWRDEGLPLGTVSNEAAKLYDACLTQIIGFYDDSRVGGIVSSMQKMHEADPNFVLGRAFNFGIRLSGTLESIQTSPDLMKEYEYLKDLLLSPTRNLDPREYLHAKGVTLWAEGRVSSANKAWEEILLDYPTDFFAIKMAYVSHLYLGNSQQLRDCPARLLPVWEAKRPCMKSYLYGLYAFGLEENNELEKAEKMARKALEEEKADGWSTHALAHVFETQGRTREGIKFMSDTVKSWEESNLLACHNYWHMALYHIENEEYEAASDILDKHILNLGFKSKTMLDIADVTSLIYRLKMLSPSCLREQHVEKVEQMVEAHSNVHISTFNDAHFMMGFAVSKRQDLMDHCLSSVASSKGELAEHPALAAPLLQAIADYSEEKYGKVVEALEPLRYRIGCIGGSTAQRDVINLMLISAALKSNQAGHRKLARALINEREAVKSTPLGRTMSQSL